MGVGQYTGSSLCDTCRGLPKELSMSIMSDGMGSKVFTSDESLLTQTVCTLGHSFKVQRERVPPSMLCVSR